MSIFVEYCSKFLNICAILRIVYSLIEEYNRPIRRDYMSVIKRIFSLFLLVLMLLLLQHVISGRIQDNYSGKNISQSCHSANSTYQHLHVRSVAKTVVKGSAPVQNYLSATLYLIFDYPYKYYTFKHFEV